jgi:hypothetical protein
VEAYGAVILKNYAFYSTLKADDVEAYGAVILNTCCLLLNIDNALFTWVIAMKTR